MSMGIQDTPTQYWIEDILGPILEYEGGRSPATGDPVGASTLGHRK